MAVTPNYSWPVPVNTDLVKDGADAIKDLGDAIDATVFGLPSGALTLVKTQVIGTAVTSVTVTGAFSTTYDAYKIVISNGAGSFEDQIRLQIGSVTSGYFSGGSFVPFNGSGIANVPVNNGAIFSNIGNMKPNGIFATIEVNSPFLTKQTLISYYLSETTGALVGAGHITNTASHTSFIINTPSGTMTGGTIRVYGYQN